MAGYNFLGKTALVTGAGQGLGKDIAKALLACRAQVFALDRLQDKLNTFKAEHPQITTVCVDLLDWKATETAIENIGHVDLLVNNAGVFPMQSLFKMKEETYESVFGVNVKATMHVTQLVARQMVAREQGGAIVNISSIASTRANVDTMIYSASKAAVTQATKVMALELGPHKIRVNVVGPTLMPTELAKILTDNPATVRHYIHKTPVGRFAQTSDVVNVVLFLLSEKAAMINGHFLPVDGGYLANL